ncbi:MAG TPA: tetratricopeptide repeat protein [Myxococcales bacterium]|nr:tetratricopeptide repeat protein [Myxococcales bacterium]
MTAELHRARAEGALQLSRWDDAAREAALMIAAEPHDSTGYAMLSRAHLGKEQYEEALKQAEAGLVHDPEREWLHRLRCHALRLQGRLAEALEAAETCVRLLPGAAEPHAVRGKVLAGLKRRKEAQAAYEKALELDPDDADLHRDLGDLFLESDPAKAEACYRRSLAIEAGDAVTLNNLGAALNRQKRADEAALAFKSAILLDPTLKVAKRNAHATINSRLGAVAGLGAGLYALSMVPRLLLKTSLPSLDGGNLAVAAIVVLLIAVFWAWRRHGGGRKANLEKLKARDPQLHAIFVKLDADKRAGRL